MYIYSKKECQTFFWLAVSYCGTKWFKEACNLQEGCFYALLAVNLSADWRSADIFETCVIQAWTRWPSPSPQVSCISAARFLDCLAFGRRVGTFLTFQVIYFDWCNQCRSPCCHVRRFQDRRLVRLERSSVMLINVSSKKKKKKERGKNKAAQMASAS